jgi:hypothetical protein
MSAAIDAKAPFDPADEVSTRLDELKAQLRAIEREIQQLQTRSPMSSNSTNAVAPDIQTPSAALSRRGLLYKSAAVVVGGAALAAGSSLLNPKPAKAANEMIMDTQNNGGAISTDIFSNAADYTFGGENVASGAGLSGYGFGGYGVIGESNQSEAIWGESHANDQTSIHGLKDATTGAAVKGENSLESNGYAAVYGLTNGSGPGTLGENTAAGNGASGVAHGMGSGIYGQSANGRGGRFAGKLAQIKLDPARTTTHPSSGQRGDLFVDNSGRLWFCKGGLTWKQLA